MQYTTNFNLNKPDLPDRFDIDHQNTNMEIIDAKMKALSSANGINIVDSGNYFTGTQVESVLQEVGENLTSINSKISEESSYYGIKYTISTDTVERVGNSVGKVAGLYPAQNDFDNIMPFASRRRCNLGDDLVVRNYYGDVGYIEDGSNGQVMVETQGFYYRKYMPDNDTIMTLISMYELPFFTWHPYFYNEAGQKVQKKYKSAYEGSLYDATTAVAEVNTITVTSPCTTNGNLVITLDNYTKVTIPVTTTMSTVDLVATAIRSATFPNIVASGTGADVILTYSITGAKNTTTINVASTGVVATVAKNTTGTGGYVTGDAQIADFTVGTGDKLCSIAGVKPISGLTQDLTLPKSRILANNRGAGWQQQYYNEISAEQLMMIVEFGTLKTQSIYNGDATNITDDTLTNMAIYTGATSSLGNKSGKVAVTHYQTGQTTYAISYRGVENFWGNIWKWVDGLNISNGNAYICKFNGGFVSDTFTGNYVKIGELGHASGYISKTMLNAVHEYGFLPTEAVGTSTSKYADYYYQNASGNLVARLGGSWVIGSNAGAFCWNLDAGSAYRIRVISARLSA